MPRPPVAVLCCVVSAFAPDAEAQSPAPGGSAAPASSWAELGDALLEREDPVGAWDAFRQAVGSNAAASGPRVAVGLGRAHLMLGRSAFAQSYARSALAESPDDQDGMALSVRALIRGRSFDEAVRAATNFLARTPNPRAELLAARASALFRVQRIDDAAAGYQRVTEVEPAHAEAHLRLGSGLLPPTEVEVLPELRAAVAAAVAGDRERAAVLLRTVLTEHPGHPIAHRLFGEVLFAERAAASMAANDPAFAALRAALPKPDVRHLPVAQFVRGYDRLTPARALVVDRVAALFGGHLEKLIAIGGAHDLLLELERTTDAEPRASLRGRRTFDGRVWDDVRGVGGIRAATGIEALDEAAQFGFDTLAHEVAHQVHLFALTPLQRARIRSLYQQALAEKRCLDYYAASNEAEYFGQGVEAFVSLGKHPGGETTHGHTRFELFAVDRELHDFVASVVAYDPLAQAGSREALLEAAVAVAVRCGRNAEAMVAASMLPAGETRDRLVAEARRAAAATRCH